MLPPKPGNRILLWEFFSIFNRVSRFRSGKERESQNHTKISHNFDVAFFLIQYFLGCCTSLTVFQTSDTVDIVCFAMFL